MKMTYIDVLGLKQSLSAAAAPQHSLVQSKPILSGLSWIFIASSKKEEAGILEVKDEMERKGIAYRGKFMQSLAFSSGLCGYLRTPRMLQTTLWGVALSLSPRRDSAHLPCGIMLIIYFASVKHTHKHS